MPRARDPSGRFSASNSATTPERVAEAGAGTAKPNQPTRARALRSGLQAEHRFVQAKGVRLSCTVAGPEDGPLVILLHGFPEFSGSWRRIIAPLARAGYRVVAPDQRGYGRSDKPSKIADYRMDLLAADVAALIAAMGRSSASIVGHDWGGGVAWWLAMTRPELVERLVIMNVPHPAVMRAAIFGDLRQLRRSWYMFAFQLPRLPELRLSFDGGKGLYERLRTLARPGSFPEQDRRHYQRAWGQPQAWRSMLNWYRAAMRHRPAAKQLHKRVAAPALILWGKLDHAIGSELANKSLNYCDDASLRYFDDAGHFVQHDARVKVLEELLNFLPDSSVDR